MRAEVWNEALTTLYTHATTAPDGTYPVLDGFNGRFGADVHRNRRR
jgi:hypothetical protein